MPDPIHIQFRPDWKCWPEADQMILEHWLASGLDPFSQNPTGSRLVLHNMIRPVWGRTQQNLKVGNWQQPVCVLPRTGPIDSCTPACFQTRRICLKPDQAIQVRSGLVFHKMIRAFRTKLDVGSRPDSGCTLAIMAISKTLSKRIRQVYWAKNHHTV